jgi:hypothetical protein
MLRIAAATFLVLSALHGLAADGEPTGAKVEAARGVSIQADLDCDGKPDRVRVYVHESRLEVLVDYANRNRQQARFSFSVSAGIQDAVCALPVYVEEEPLDYDLAEIVGGPVPGFVRSETCKGLVIADHRCDSLHFFWNRKNRRLEWWRL